MKLGVAGLVPDWEKIDEAAARRVRAAGFRGVSLFFPRPLEAEAGAVARLKSALDAAGLEAAQANGWYECLVNPDDALRANGVRGLMALTRIGRAIGAKTVYVRPGSLNPRGHWYPHPDNHSAATFDRLVASLREAAAGAAREGMTLAIEGHVLSPLDTARRVRDLLSAVGSGSLQFNLDAVNLVGTVRDAHDPRRLIEETFELLGDRIAAAHMKDCALEDELVVHIRETAIGAGSMDNGLILRRLGGSCPGVYCIIEHLPDAQVPPGREALLAAARDSGVVLEG